MTVRTRVGGVAAALAMLIVGCESGTSEKDINDSVVYGLADVRQAIDLRDREDPDHAVLIDPRAPQYFDAGHLPGAVNLRLHEVREDDPRDPSLERFSRLIVYGQNPGTAVARAMFKRLLAVGYDGVRLYRGGVDEWLLSGGALETASDDGSSETEPVPD